MFLSSFTTKPARLAIPLVLSASVASAGGMAEPVVVPEPVAVPVAAPLPTGSDWTGFYAGAQLGYGQLKSDGLSTDPDGLMYGVHAGYLYDLGTWVVGGEIDYDISDIEEEGDDVALDSVLRGKVRVGYDAGDWLPYLTAGVASATTSGALDASDTGAFGGLGLDYRVSDSIRVGAEVLQHSFPEFDNNDFDIDATTAALRVSFEF
ncbi:outer membrane protein [Yoonia litorea]|uniref:Opacity protein n=1 Tax=Yoonia litorea TaxID=1123755 RepID=A0A1I6M9T2_9RHOB|nr:outer membrane beta-barrel protein [Yoonia litorea]SFS12459.1 Opacity protein [Yoonia litorea]